VVGYVYSKAASVGGYGIIWQLLPHGIFELPAIFISLGLGVKLGMFVFEKDKKKAFIERLRKSFFVFLTIVLPLLVIAAIIEGLLISLT
jgi:stage II sporulation protein M